MGENKKPAIRFRGFTDAWEQRKVGDYYYFKNGLNKGKEFFGYGIPIVNFTDVFHNRGIYALNLKGKVDLQPSEIANYKVQKGDIFFTRTSETIDEIGYSSVMLDEPKDTVFSGFVLRGRAIDDDPLTINFKRYVFYTDVFRKEMVIKSSMTTRALTSGTAIKQMEFYFPEIKDEQDKIGQFFQSLDNLITLHQRKYDKLQNIKKSMLEKMFPKNGMKTPEVRFKGFTDAWEQRKLGELTDVYDGTHQTPQYTDDGIMFLSVENIKTLQSLKYISEEAFKTEFKVFPEKGDVLMTRIGDIGTANVFESNEPTAYYVSLALLKCKELDPYFLKESIYSETVKKDLWHRTLHIAFPKKINKNEIEKVQIPYPDSRLEQERIGTFFRNLDNLITLHQRELDKLQNIKKSCLKKMFV
jgi:type I restriction enzyme S subunit